MRLLGEGRLERLVLERNRLQGPAFKQAARGTGETEELPCGILFRSIGYKGLPMAGVPFDERSGVMPNRSGRVQDANGSVVPQSTAPAGSSAAPPGSSAPTARAA